MKYLMFSNKGELDLNGLRLMGASTKRSDAGQIGYFGSGWKYAMAVLLRHRAEIIIYSGTRRVPITVAPTSLRDQSFDEVIIDGKPSGLTTSIGPKWEKWMGIRELWCNALDEGEAVIDVVATPCGAPGYTRVYVSYEHVQDVHQNWAKYFRRDADPNFEYKAKLLPKVDNQTRIYRRGILIHVDPQESLWDYEVPNCPISEERAAKGPDILSHCWNALDSAGIDAKRSTLNDLRPFEQNLPQWFAVPSNSWAEVLGEQLIATRSEVNFWRDEPVIKSAKVLPDAWVSALKKLPEVSTVDNSINKRTRVTGAQMAANPIRANSMDGNNLRGALKLLAKVDITIQDHEVVLVDGFADDWIRGMWAPADKLIYVKKGLSFEELVHVLTHEWIHKVSGADDHERAFETAQGDLITRLILKIGGHRGR